MFANGRGIWFIIGASPAFFDETYSGTAVESAAVAVIADFIVIYFAIPAVERCTYGFAFNRFAGEVSGIFAVGIAAIAIDEIIVITLFFFLDDAVTTVIDAFTKARAAIVLRERVFLSRITFFTIFDVDSIVFSITAKVCRLTKCRAVIVDAVIGIPLAFVAAFTFIDDAVAAGILGTGFAKGRAFPTFLNDAFVTTVIGIVIFIITFFAFVEFPIATGGLLYATVRRACPTLFDVAVIVAAVVVNFVAVIALFVAFDFAIAAYGFVFDDRWKVGATVLCT